MTCFTIFLNNHTITTFEGLASLENNDLLQLLRLLSPTLNLKAVSDANRKQSQLRLLKAIKKHINSLNTLILEKKYTDPTKVSTSKKKVQEPNTYNLNIFNLEKLRVHYEVSIKLKSY